MRLPIGIRHKIIMFYGVIFARLCTNRLVSPLFQIHDDSNRLQIPPDSPNLPNRKTCQKLMKFWSCGTVSSDYVRSWRDLLIQSVEKYASYDRKRRKRRKRRKVYRKVVRSVGYLVRIIFIRPLNGLGSGRGPREGEAIATPAA